MNYKISELKQTCDACPSQWEGYTEKGEDVYIRYRWGDLSVYINEICIFTATLGDNLDGVISIEEVEEELNKNNILLELNESYL